MPTGSTMMTTKVNYSCEICCHGPFSSTSDLKCHILLSHYGSNYDEAQVEIDRDQGNEPGTGDAETDPLWIDATRDRLFSEDSLPRPFKCDACGVQFAFRSTLELHEQEVHRVRTDQFVESSNASSEKNSMTELNQELDPDQESGERESGKRRSSKTGGRIATRLPRSNRSKGRDVYPCPFCDQTFRSVESHRLHVRQAHSQFFCGICKRSIPCLDRMKHLQEFHFGLTCPICKEDFQSWTFLNIHAATSHPDDKIFSCPICSKAFSTSKAVREHLIRIHKISFVNDANESRKDDPDFNCPMCRKSFRHKKTLTVHISNVHDTDNPCIKCGKGFPTLEFLNQHVIEVHKGVPRRPSYRAKIKCALCNTKLLSENQLQLHLVSKHGDNSKKGQPKNRKKKKARRKTVKTSENLTNFEFVAEEDTVAMKEVTKVDDPEQDEQVFLADVSTEDLELYEDGDRKPDDDELQSCNSIKIEENTIDRLEDELENFERLIGNEPSLSSSSSINAEPVSTKSPNQGKPGDQTREPNNSSGSSPTRKIFVFISELTKLKMPPETFDAFKKTLAAQFATAVWLKSVGPDINCSSINYNSDDSCAVISCINEKSVDWFKETISRIQLGDQRFRAWQEGETPKAIRMTLALPDTFEQLNHIDIEAAVNHFNSDSCDMFSVLSEETRASGRVLEVEVGPLLHQACQNNNWSLNFLMGTIECKPSITQELL